MKDQSGNLYFEASNARITVVPQTWDESPGIRIQAYKEDGGLFFGPEIPIHTKGEAFDLIHALLLALDNLNLQ